MQKTVFAEHAVDDLDGKKGKKKDTALAIVLAALEDVLQDKQAGRQRGFIVLGPLQTISPKSPKAYVSDSDALLGLRRVDQDERVNVLPSVQATAGKGYMKRVWVCLGGLADVYFVF